MIRCKRNIGCINCCYYNLDELENEMVCTNENIKSFHSDELETNKISEHITDG